MDRSCVALVLASLGFIPMVLMFHRLQDHREWKKAERGKATMGKETNISWTDHTFNPWWGCTKVSPGCDSCYAEEVDLKWQKSSPHWGKGVPRRTFGDAHWQKPLQWSREAAGRGVIANVFCGSMCDVMDDEAPDGEFERLCDLINLTPNLRWLLLTKRPHRYERRLPACGFKHDNVMLGATTENQPFYKARIGVLTVGALKLWARNRDASSGVDRQPVQTFVSYEPALGPITMLECGVIPDWLIFGGETGKTPRPMDQAWAENIKAECADLGVSFFMKQMSASTPTKAAQLIPAHLLLRQFPHPTTGDNDAI